MRMKCSDDYLDALKYLFGDNVEFVKMEDVMRFKVGKVTGESISVVCCEDVCTIVDSMDEDSPVSSLRMLKPNADKFCDWLNENIKEKVLSPKDRIDKAVKKLWQDDEVMVEYYGELFFLIELKSTNIVTRNIADALGIPDHKVGYEPIAFDKSIYRISKGDLDG